MPPRATPGDYQAQAPAGTVTVAADFLGHAILTPDGATYMMDDYVAVETGLFGPSGARLKISSADFSLRILAKKKMKPLPSEPFGGVLKSLKDPEWEDTAAIELKKAKDEKGSGGISTGGQNQDNTPPVAPKMPLPMRRAMEQRVEKCVLPEGDRSLPQAGVIFFPYHGKAETIHAVELIYDGPAGKATLKLQP